jgi:hypothetical protein
MIPPITGTGFLEEAVQFAEKAMTIAVIAAMRSSPHP